MNEHYLEARVKSTDIERRQRFLEANTRIRNKKFLNSVNTTEQLAWCAAEIFQIYDEVCLDSWIRLNVEPVKFSVSRRMKKYLGKTNYRIVSHDRLAGVEVVLSAKLLNWNLRTNAYVCGLKCLDRVDVIQRAIEHELIHVVELSIWRNSDCRKAMFAHLSSRLFFHQNFIGVDS